MNEEINPYKAPESTGAVEDAPKRRHAAGCVRGSLGCGCVVPLLLFVAAALSGDVGGPLFWPIIAVFGAIVGGIIGAIFAPYEKRKD